MSDYDRMVAAEMAMRTQQFLESQIQFNIGLYNRTISVQTSEEGMRILNEAMIENYNRRLSATELMRPLQQYRTEDFVQDDDQIVF